MSRSPSRRPTGKSRGNKIEGRFVALPESVFNSPAYLALTPWAVRLLIDLMAQYNGKNNGDLSTAWKLMQPRKWNSETTLQKAKRELLAAGFIFETRQGRRPNRCSLYALTWRALDPSPKHDFGPNEFTPRAFEAVPEQVRLRGGVPGKKTATPFAVVSAHR